MDLKYETVCVVVVTLQHCLACVSGSVSTMLIVAPALCVVRLQDVSDLITTMFFVDGLVTLLQTTLGVRSVLDS